MFINSITKVNKELPPCNSINIYNTKEEILYYGFNNIQYARVVIKKDYPLSDNKGNYRLSIGCGGRVKERYIEQYKKKPQDFIIKGASYCKKIYEQVDYQPLSNVWEIPNNKSSSYPTQKPYKLLERIINISTI